MPPLLYAGGQLVTLVQHFPPSVRAASVQCDRHGRHTAYMPFVVYTLRHILCNLSSKQPSISLLLPKYFGWPLVPFFHFLSIVDHQVKETKLIYCFPKITACSNHKATNLHEVTWTSWPFVSNIRIQTSDLLHIRHMVLCFTQGGLCIGWPTALWGTIWCSCELAIRISRG